MHQGQETAARTILVKKATATSENIQQLKEGEDIGIDEDIGTIDVRKFRSRTKYGGTNEARSRAPTRTITLGSAFYRCICCTNK